MLALLSAVWGASYLLIAEAIEEIPESLVVLARSGLAAVALLAVIAVRGGESARLLADARRRPGTAFLLGGVAIALPFMLITFGERTVPSGLSAVLIASAPIFIAILAPFLDRSEIMSPLQWAGLGVGIAGVALLVGVEQLGSPGELLGGLAMIGAAASYALSGFVLKRGYPGVPPIVTTFLSVATSAVLVLPAAVAQPPQEVPGPGAILAVLVLALVGTAWAFVVYFRLIAEIGFGRASVVAYTIPPVALAYGWALRDEAISAATVAGMVLILAGVFLVARGRQVGSRDPIPVPPSLPHGTDTPR
jgi:drug/metabolite transporter (DMT)-like permease